MKIKCKPLKGDRKRDSSPIQTRLWKESLPFNVNPRGVLVHRVRYGATHFRNGERSHDSVTYWCNNSAVGEGVNLADEPPNDRLLCSHCEGLAVEHEEPSAESLVGRHVCIGVMKAFRLCCRNEQN